jgi:hypothetical protein
MFGEKGKAADKRLVDAAEKANKADKQYKAAKRTANAAKKMAKVEAKNVKQAYREQYMKGESSVGKFWAKLTGSDKYYADMMYDMNKGKYKDSKK